MLLGIKWLKKNILNEENYKTFIREIKHFWFLLFFHLKNIETQRNARIIPSGCIGISGNFILFCHPMI